MHSFRLFNYDKQIKVKRDTEKNRINRHWHALACRQTHEHRDSIRQTDRQTNVMNDLFKLTRGDFNEILLFCGAISLRRYPLGPSPDGVAAKKGRPVTVGELPS